jgi:activator of 2-hydroxyglutaryl-CoA dehydratase
MQEIKRVEIKATAQFKAVMSQHFLELDAAAQTNPHPQLTGAYGAALIARESLG